MKFILSRNRDCETHSKKWMLGYALLFWIISRIVAIALMAICISIYGQFGISPSELTSFGGDPTIVKSSGNILRGLLMIALIAPVFEELLFRYGLSFKRFAVAVSCACIPLFLVYSNSQIAGIAMWLICIGCSIAVFCGVFFATTNEFWRSKKQLWQVKATWITSIAFGLVHLCAFTHLSWMLLPYALVLILVPFFAGCACAYLRVNMGFGWGIAIHIFNNLPGIVMLLCSI